MALNDTGMGQPLALVLFSRQFACLLEAGISLARSLLILEQNAPPPYGESAGELRRQVEGGATLSVAMQARPERFSSFYVRMVRMGEISGTLEEFLAFLADLLEEGWKITRLSGQAKKVAWLFNPTSRLTAEDWSELNDRQRAFTLMLFCRSLGMALSAGVPPRLALETAADLLPTTQREAVRTVAQGDPAQGTAEALARIGFLPTLVTQLMEAGEKHGAFDQMMDRAADVYRHTLECQML